MRQSGTSGFALIAALGLLSACSGGLYTAEGLPSLDGGGGVCAAPTVQCAGSADCLAPTIDHCSQCTPCATAPSNGKMECLARNGTTQPYQCVSSCNEGWLSCRTGCCRAVTVAAGGDHTCAVTDDTTLRCWGANGSGQVRGNSTSVSEPFPVTVVDQGAGFVLAAGFEHTCAVVNGAVQCWGANGAGRATPPALTGVTGLAAGQAHTCAIAGGTVTCWGDNTLGQTAISLGGLTPAARIVAGANHTCTLDGGAVRCWGDDRKSQLGPGPGTPFAAGSGIASIGAGHDHTCVADGVTDGLRCWGANPGGVVLPGLPDPQATPAIPPKEGGSGQSIVGGKVVGLIAAGRAHTCATLPIAPPGPFELPVCFGDNSSLQLGNATPPPQNSVQVLGSMTPDPRVISAGAEHTCAITAGNELTCWGRNDSGQLGKGDRDAQVSPGGAVFVSGR